MSAYIRPVLRVNRVIVGNGPASVRALKAFTSPRIKSPDVDLQLLRVGDHSAKDHSWQRTFDNLLMGQPPGMLLKDDESPGVFTKVADFNKREQKMAVQALADNAGLDMQGHVVKVDKVADQEIVIQVLLPNNRLLDIVAREAIFAQGAGLDKEVAAPKNHRYSLRERPFGEYTTGSKSLTGTTKMISSAEILIFGDGATAMWNAEHYLANGNEVFVVGPDNDRAFKNANPGGRNSEVYSRLLNEGRLLTATIEGIEERNQIREFSDPSESGILVYLKNQATLGHGKRASAVIPTSRVISAVGSANHTLQHFHPAIVASLSPVLEKGYEGTVAIGLATPNFDIVICGAQAVSEGANLGQGALFDLAGSRIGQPAPGILTLEASVRSLRRYQKMREVGADEADLLAMQDLVARPDLDPYSANRLEFTMYFISLGVHEAAALQMADLSIQVRAKYISEGKKFDNFQMARTTTKLLKGSKL